jgi:hydroxypyruvate reductase
MVPMIFPGEDSKPPATPLADPTRFLYGLYEAMVNAADPRQLLSGRLPAQPAGRTIVVGAGKAAAAMAQAVEEHWPGDLDGLVVTRYGHGLPCRNIEVVEAGHPLPDTQGADAARRILEIVHGLSPDDLVLVLLSGGGSALLSVPAPGLDLPDLKVANQQLLASGASISEINCVRKHLSALTGGRLAVAAWPAEVLTLAISDVPGDDPSVVASGPTVGDPSTFADARGVVHRYGLHLPPAVHRHLEAGRDETPKPGDPRLERSRFSLLATPATALEAAASAARDASPDPVVLGAEVQGEARVVAAEHAALVRRLAASSPPPPAGAGVFAGRRPLLVLSGGETTVTVRGTGRGGRNTEYLLALALALEETGGPGGGAPVSVYALAADTDGIDGTGDAAGAFLYPDSLPRGRAAGLDPEACLATNDSYGFFAGLGDLLGTGPTRTNVNDFRAILLL